MEEPSYDELVKALRGPYDTHTDIYYMKQAADAIEELIKEKSELLWCINYMAACDNCKYFYMVACDNCKYFGGCCCDHVDEDGNCLGWELLRKPTEEERKAYDEYMAEAIRIAKQVLDEKKE